MQNGIVPVLNKNWSRPLANSPQARKRARQNDKRRAHNTDLESKMRTTIKQARAAATGGDKDAAKKAFQVAARTIDMMVPKGIVPKNKAARLKSRLNQAVKGS